MNFKLLKIALLVILLVGLYFFFQGGAIFVTDKQPLPPVTNTEAPAVITPAKESMTKAAESPTSGTIGLSQESPNTQSAPPPNSDFSYSLKKENNERQITPGVSFIPKEGISIKTDRKDETVQLQRDHTYNGDYQVMWKKKY